MRKRIFKEIFLVFNSRSFFIFQEGNFEVEINKLLIKEYTAGQCFWSYALKSESKLLYTKKIDNKKLPTQMPLFTSVNTDFTKGRKSQNSRIWTQKVTIEP